MKTTPIVFATLLLATAASAQPATAPSSPNSPPGATSNAPQAGVNPSTGTTPGTSMSDRNSGTAAASGDRNQAVTTTSSNAPQPAKGANSFSRGEARRRIQSEGFQKVVNLHKDSGGVWRGKGTKDGQQVAVWLDYKGNVGQAQ